MGLFSRKKKLDAPLDRPPPIDGGLDKPPPLDADPSFPPMDSGLSHPPDPLDKPVSFDSGDHMGLPSRIPSFGSSSRQPDFSSSNFSSQPVVQTSTSLQGPDNKDIQLILSKLDLIRSELDGVAQRVVRIERSLEEKPKYKW